jgi:hypothetical protein
MFGLTIQVLARASTQTCSRSYIASTAVRQPTFQFNKPTTGFYQPNTYARFYSGGHAKPSFEEVRDRVLNVVKAFEKVDAAKVCANVEVCSRCLVGLCFSLFLCLGWEEL